MSKTYIFNQSTLRQAIDIWVAQQQASHPQNKEVISIFEVAIPWFMKYLKQTNPVYILSEKDLIDGLEQWEKIQLSNFPQQSTRIRKVCKLISVFFQSEVVREHKMFIV